MSGGSSKSDSSTTQSLWQPQADQMESMLGQMPELQQGISDQMPGIQSESNWWNKHSRRATE